MAQTPTRAVSTASIQFGLVSVPCKTMAATENHDMSFKSFHVHDDGTASQISAPFICKDCGASCRNETVKGIERDGKLILITKDELAVIDDGVGADYEVVEFVPADALNPLLYEQSYYLTPDPKKGKQAAEAYAVLRAVMETQDKVGIVRYSQRGKTHLAALRVVADGEGQPVIVLHNMLWPNELREHDFEVLRTPVNVNEKLLAVAAQMVEAMTADSFDADAYTDEAQQQLIELIDAKAAGVAVPVRAEKAAVEDVGDLLAKLQASVAAAPKRAPKAPAKAPAASRTAAEAKAKHPAGKAAPRKAAARKSA